MLPCNIVRPLRDVIINRIPSLSVRLCQTLLFYLTTTWMLLWKISSSQLSVGSELGTPSVHTFPFHDLQLVRLNIGVVLSLEAVLVHACGDTFRCIYVFRAT